MTRSRRGVIFVAACGAFSLAAACASGPRASALAADTEAARLSQGFDPEVQESIARVRAVTAPFQVLDSAVAAGYQRDGHDCVAHPEQGAMGFHHGHTRYVDDRVEVERPEILVFERLADGRYVLNGVEYVIPYTLRPREASPPTIMGQRLKRADRLGLWYLHAWIWKENPSGLFADWNPTVQCRAG